MTKKQPKTAKKPVVSISEALLKQLRAIKAESGTGIGFFVESAIEEKIARLQAGK